MENFRLVATILVLICLYRVFGFDDAEKGSKKYRQKRKVIYKKAH